MSRHFTFDAALERLGTRVMAVNGLSCIFNLPPATVSTYRNGEEIAQNLPPYGERTAFCVDDFDHACPKNWVRGSDKDASFFVPVQNGRGVWLDFNQNASHTHHVAMVLSVQGVNAITHLPTEGRFHLEQYKTVCPVHNIPFGEGRYCAECKFKWNPQNYLASTGTPLGHLWIDGFWATDGVTRQFIFTEEVMRGIAAQIIGKDRVFAIGIAFFLSKEPKPKPKTVIRRMHSDDYPVCLLTLGSVGPATLGGSSNESKGVVSDDSDDGAYDDGGEVSCFLAAMDTSSNEDAICSFEEITVHDSVDGGTAEEEDSGLSRETDRSMDESQLVVPKTKLEIGAGARIDQEIYPDPEPIEFWQSEPAGFIYINYVDEETARAILAQGKQDRTAGGEGWMAPLKKGNPGVLPG